MFKPSKITMAEAKNSASLKNGLRLDLSFDTATPPGWLSIGDDDNQHVLSETEDSLRSVAGQCWRPCLPAGAREKDLRDLIATPKIDQGRSNVVPFQNSGLYVQVAREVQMPFHGFAIRRGQAA